MDNYREKFEGLYSSYIDWSRELMGSYGGIKMFAQMFTGGAEYKNREEHMDFFRAAGTLAEEYMVELKSGSADRDGLMEILRYVLLDCHGVGDDWAEWMLLAVEKHFIAFVELLSREEAAALLEPYKKLRRRNKGLPPQDEILKKLKKLSR